MCAAAALALPTLAAEILVTSLSGGTGGPDCTLRDAITAANTDTATGGCPAGSGADTVTLPLGETIVLTEAHEAIDGASGLPSITTEIVLQGDGATVRRDDSLTCNLDGVTDPGEFRIARVAVTGSLTLDDVTLADGCADGPQGTFAGGGGALLVVGSSTLDGSTLTGNRASNTGGAAWIVGGSAVASGSVVAANSAGSGGGLTVGGGSLTFSGGVIEDNSATAGPGGGIYVIGGSAVLDTVTVAGNQASSSGGGVFSLDELTVLDSTISDNLAGSSGGGLGSSNIANLFAVTNSTISGNRVVRNPGSFVGGNGGGIWNAGPMQVSFTTVTDNSATVVGDLGTSPGSGGGLYIDTNAEGQVVEIKHSIVAVNGAAGDCDGSTALLTAVGENLSSDDSCPGFTLPDTQPLLGPLADNGGPTETHALLAGSPALDAIAETACEDLADQPVLTDQRGVARPQDGDGDTVFACDIGAFEQDVVLQVPSVPVTEIPTLDTWGALLLAALLGGIAAARLRRRTSRVTGGA